MDNGFRSMRKYNQAENIGTIANYLTLLRVIACSIIFAIAFLDKNIELCYVGLAIHWVFDMLDGFFARLLKQETVLGAQFDIFADRYLIILFFVIFAQSHGFQFIAILLYIFEFVFLDSFLSIQFLNWDIISPNYFYLINKKIWLLNWSPAAKFLNSSLVILLLIFEVEPFYILAVIAVILGVKIYSFSLLQEMTRRIKEKGNTEIIPT